MNSMLERLETILELIVNTETDEDYLANLLGMAGSAIMTAIESLEDE